MIDLNALTEALVSLGHLEEAPEEVTWDAIWPAYAAASGLAQQSTQQPMYQGDLTAELLEAYLDEGGADTEQEVIDASTQQALELSTESPVIEASETETEEKVVEKPEPAAPTANFGKKVFVANKK